jgi:riboflavin biosynthesis pyrimidine reductase
MDNNINSDVALKRVQGIGEYGFADYKLLNAGWSYSDAVLITGQILRDEPEACCSVQFPDLNKHRTETLKLSDQPIQLILSESCNLDFMHPIFCQPDLRVFVLTSTAGKERGENLFRKRKKDGVPSVSKTEARVSTALFEASMEQPVSLEKGAIQFIPFNQSSETGLLNLQDIMDWIYTRLDVRRLDVSSGGTVIRRFVDMKLLDEIRLVFLVTFLDLI